jgi:NADH:ubiquinone oxidoreductase subunit E
MNPADINKYSKELEYSALLDSLQELFEERGEVTATDVAERMEQKLHRHYG